MIRNGISLVLVYFSARIISIHAISCDVNSPCPGGQFCNYEQGTSGFCANCINNCDEDGLLSGGESDCFSACTNGPYNPTYCDPNTSCGDELRFCHYENATFSYCKDCDDHCDDEIVPIGITECTSVCLAVDYGIGETGFEFINEETLSVHNAIGRSVSGAVNVQIELLDIDCSISKTKTGLEIEIHETPYNNNGTFSYLAAINPGLVHSSPGGFATFGDKGFSQGTLNFCTSVSTWSGTIPVSFRETKFRVGFNLTNYGFNVDGVHTQEDVAMDFNFDVDSNFKVSGCQCDRDFNCNSNVIINQGESLSLCIYPDVNAGSSADPKSVHISNFNLFFSAGSGSNYVASEPVQLGASTWVTSSLASTEERDGKIRIVAPVTASFFLNGHTQLNIDGNVYFSYSHKTAEFNKFSSFGMTVEILSQTKSGCLQNLLRRLGI